MNFGRVLTAMVTPFTDEGELNYDEAACLADYLVTHGSDGLVVCGTTGESPTLTWQEEYELFRVVRDAVAGRAKVIAGTGSNSTREAVEATKKAAQLGLDGSLQVVPYYNKPTQAGLYEHFKTIAQASDLPILLYNIPSRTGASLQPETVAKLAELETVVAIKEASGMMDVASEIRRLTPSRFAIYSGDDSLTLPLLSLGGERGGQCSQPPGWVAVAGADPELHQGATRSSFGPPPAFVSVVQGFVHRDQPGSD